MHQGSLSLEQGGRDKPPAQDGGEKGPPRGARAKRLSVPQTQLQQLRHPFLFAAAARLPSSIPSANHANLLCLFLSRNIFVARSGKGQDAGRRGLPSTLWRGGCEVRGNDPTEWRVAGGEVGAVSGEDQARHPGPGSELGPRLT